MQISVAIPYEIAIEVRSGYAVDNITLIFCRPNEGVAWPFWRVPANWAYQHNPPTAHLKDDFARVILHFENGEYRNPEWVAGRLAHQRRMLDGPR